MERNGLPIFPVMFFFKYYIPVYPLLWNYGGGGGWFKKVDTTNKTLLSPTGALHLYVQNIHSTPFPSPLAPTIQSYAKFSNTNLFFFHVPV